MRWRAPLRGRRCATLSRFARLEPTRVLTLPQAIAGISGTKKAALLQLSYQDGGEGGIMRWRAPLRGRRCATLSRFARLEPTRVLTLPQAIAAISGTKKAALLQLSFQDGGEGGIRTLDTHLHSITH